MAKPKSEMIGWRRQIRIDPSTWEALKAYAKAQEIEYKSPDAVLRDAIEVAAQELGTKGRSVLDKLSHGEQVNTPGALLSYGDNPEDGEDE